jgi:hypothetical protein
MSSTDSYYSNLLILEYHNKPKAKATIEACVALMPDDLLREVLGGFDIETAVGKQLDILGEYVGVDRYYLVDNQAELLSDEDYRILIKLKAISNTSNLSHKSLNEALYNFFGNAIRMDSEGNMEMTYFVPKNKTPIILAAIQKEVLPRPMGVRCSYIIEYDKKFFGFCTYQNQTAVYKTGFRTYNNPDKAGEVLTYSKRIEF